MRRIVLVLLAVMAVLSGCVAWQAVVPPVRGERTELTVFAAASLSEAFAEMAEAFEAAHPGVAVTLNVAGSQQLAQQIAQGAPADVFASANTQQMAVAVEAGRIPAGAAIPFAHNRLAVVMPPENPAGITTLQDLARPGIKLILAAEAVPVGRYSRVFLEEAGRDDAFPSAYKEKVLANAVSLEQNVRAVLSKVRLGEADAGIVYASDVGADAAAVIAIPIPDALNTVAGYPIAVLADARQPALARQFVAFVRGAEGQAILARYGFLP